ncbi:acetylglucosamine transferase [Mitsuaria sp. WAJ17]|uniref:O-linked N-acetylglucosamine transferase, SPINDLY family protein n=1 Tax=Mitsuaria sp. WAJ17 TaxID=2761452 RepID=UPI0016041F04|nr:acetylglucosamine transferase [Mitsuaria sp. WAJ17]MBB2485748.1 acetylglucosamine transferase [Mitsuaria sp. WAJ17]
MDMSQPAAALLDQATSAEASIDRARAGAMPLQELMSLAHQWQTGGRQADCLALYEAWVDSNQSPQRLLALFNWGTVLGEMRRHAEAEAVYLRALALNPDFAQAKLNLGHQLEHQGKTAEALAQWQAVYDAGELMAIGAEPVELRLHALNNAARLLESERRLDESEALMKRSLLLKPEQGDVQQHYVHIRQKQCEWPIYQPVGEVTHNQLLVNTSLLATLSATDDPAIQLMVAQRFVNERVVKYKGKPFHQLHGGPAGEKIRIGYLSGDLRMHAVGLLTPELFELHDRSRFEVHALCWSKEDGTAQRARILKAMDRFMPLAGVEDQQAARQIAEAGIDVMVDLQGLTSGARPSILAYRPAPVQVGYLGLPATSALPGEDYIIADRFTMPPEYLPLCTEKPIYLPHCYQVSDRQREVGPTPDRARYGLPEGAFVFCSFNNNHKYTEEMFSAWMQILQQVPGSLLWLLADNTWAEANMRAAAQARGVAPERLHFAPRVAPPEYLARFQLADLVLDTFPYNAGTTASDCLWMGTPILTRAGRCYISRMAGSLLTAAGLPELVTYSLPEYIERAVQIGRQPLRAASYKRYLREQGRQTPLFDIPALVRDLEHEFERLVLEHRRKAPGA